MRAVNIWKQLEAEGLMGSTDVLEIVEGILRRVQKRELDEDGFYSEDYSQRLDQEKLERKESGRAVFALRDEIDEGLLEQSVY